MRVVVLSLALGLALSVAERGLGQLTPEQHQNLVRTSQDLARRGLRYSARWLPPGEAKPWIMDCSNTARWLYKSALGKDLPRTASDQYVALMEQGRITPAPKRRDGSIDLERLFGQLRSGDLLFWEWTYNTKRTPPITHVMVYLGRTANGVHKMFGANTRSQGELSGTRGGPDIYIFDPRKPMGGVRGPQDGRFVAFGRPG
ncbi:MAG: hypothetical protein OHK005_00520 [Candidatus Methylacidiphilales bacterium]